MVEVWWSLLGAAIPAIVAGQAYRIRRNHAEEQRIKSARGREKSTDDIFVCERVCTSKRMLKKVGAFSKDPIPDTCVTVCGVSELDACSDACARTVCVDQHQVPNWNDVCLRRCQSECLKLSSSFSSWYCTRFYIMISLPNLLRHHSQAWVKWYVFLFACLLNFVTTYLTFRSMVCQLVPIVQI